jgi:hypothetical protein
MFCLGLHRKIMLCFVTLALQDPNYVAASNIISSVPNPDPSDPYVFGSPGSGSGSISYNYGSGPSINNKNGKKNLDSHGFATTFDFLYLKNDVNAHSKSNMQKNIFFKLVFVGVLKVNDENSRTRIHTTMAWIRNTDYTT